MEALPDRLDGATNVLVAAPSLRDSGDVCTTLLTEGLEEPSVLFVTFTRSVADCEARVAAADVPVGTVGVVVVGEPDVDPDREAVVTRTVTSPSDLTGLGIEIAQVIADWPAPIAVCVDSLTAMLQYVDFETAYEFLHTITGQLAAGAARAHYHIDPDAHDPQAVAALTGLMDARVGLADGEVSVRTRDLVA